MILPTAILYVALLVCAIGIGLLVRKYDLYIREPLAMMLLAVALGALAMWVATQVQLAAIRHIWDLGRTVTDPVLAILAGVTEEGGKLSVVVFFAVFLRKSFDEPLDGIVYGSFAGLGVAVLESVWVISAEVGLKSLPPQEPVRLAGHVIMGGIGGFGLGAMLAKTRYTPLWIAGSYLGAVTLHSLWDMVAFSAATHYERTSEVRPVHSLAAVAIMLSGMIAYRRLVTVGARMTRAMLQACDLATKKCPPE